MKSSKKYFNPFSIRMFNIDLTEVSEEIGWYWSKEDAEEAIEQIRLDNRNPNFLFVLDRSKVKWRINECLEKQEER